MATQQQYAVATAAVLKIVQADIAKSVPTMFQNQIPQQAVQQFAAAAAKAALDAVMPA